jgi:hypothetical protein
MGEIRWVRPDAKFLYIQAGVIAAWPRQLRIHGYKRADLVALERSGLTPLSFLYFLVQSATESFLSSPLCLYRTYHRGRLLHCTRLLLLHGTCRLR